MEGMLDDVLRPIHGGTDEGPEPLYDFSTNANALGPNPVALAYLRRADPSRYPDPLYRRLRRALAEAHGVSPEQVAVGTGTSELIHRLARWTYLRGPILLLPPPSASTPGPPGPWICPSGRRKAPRPSWSSFPKFPRLPLRAQQPHGGGLPLPGGGGQARRGRPGPGPRLLRPHGIPPPLPQTAFRLYSPNKAHGLTGVRAGYLLAPLDLTHFQNLAPSWPLSVYGEAFLHAHLDPEARAWLEGSKRELFRLRGLLAEGLRRLGLEVRESPANFLMVRVGRATEVAKALRERGIRVRDCTSFGLPEWLRLSAQREEAIRALLLALEEVLAGKLRA